MANIIVNSDANCIMVDFGIYAPSPSVNEDKSTYPRRSLLKVSKPYGDDWIVVIMSVGGSREEWFVSYQEVPGNPNVFIIDTIDGTAPTTLDQLMTLIGALIVA